MTKQLDIVNFLRGFSITTIVIMTCYRDLNYPI